MSGKFNLRQESVKGGLLDCPVRLGLNRGKLADRDIGENKAWYKRVPPDLKMIAVKG